MTIHYSNYAELEQIYRNFLHNSSKFNPNIIIRYLNTNDVKLRNKDGVLHSITISKPTSINDSFVIGLRYIKIDKSKSEDLFLVRKDWPIKKGYRGKLEKFIPEYKGTHKLDR